MFTVWFDVPRLRPDYARFDTANQAADAVCALINTRFAGRPIRVRVTKDGAVRYMFERA